MRPQNADTYKRQLWGIIKENPDYWLKSENSWALMLEWIDRYRIKLGSLKEALQRAYIPTMDTLIRRVREIKEEIKEEQNQPQLNQEERERELLIATTQ